VLSFIKARNKGVLKLAGNPSNWNSFVSSSIPLRSAIYLKDNISQVLEIIFKYRSSEQTTGDLLAFVKETENIISEFPSEQFNIDELPISDTVRELWIIGDTMSSFDDKIIKITNQYFGYIIPWAINAISRILLTEGMEEESNEFNTLAIIIQMGLPNMLAVKIYLSGIHSRISATELSKELNTEYQELSIKKLRLKLISLSGSLSHISEDTKSWLSLLKSKNSKVIKYCERISDFTFRKGLIINSSILNVKKFNEEIYLCSPDYRDRIKVKTNSRFPFDKYVNNFSVYFQNENETWSMKLRNPYLKFNPLDDTNPFL